MAASYQDFKDLDLNRDEVERLTEALKDKKFRELLTEYVDEVRNPENKKLYQKEITQLEKERGIDVTFINPVAGYVIKTSVDGDKKAFINICANENVSKPSSSVGVKDGAQGRHWTVPHTLAPPKEDYDKKMVRCQVYDVVFHPETLLLAHKFKAFREMVNKTACDAIEKNFAVNLDRKNLRFPKIQFKGMAQATVIRKPSKEPPPELNEEEKAIMDEFYSKSGANYPQATYKPPHSLKKNENEDPNSLYSTPKYIIKHCRHITMDEFTEHKEAKLNVAIPKELIVEIELPLLRSSTDIILDVTEKSLQLTSEKPAKYNLFITLPYKCNQDSGNAKFVKDKKILIVTLPVLVKNKFVTSDICKDDSGVESDPGSLVSNSPSDHFEPISNSVQIIGEEKHSQVSSPRKMLQQEVPFLDHNLYYSLPDYTINVYNNILSLTLNVRNVDNTSIEKLIGSNDFHIKFCSISSGFYMINYAFYLKFPHHQIDTNSVSIEPWDNNVEVQINLHQCDIPLHSYYYGANKNDLSKNFLPEALIIQAKTETIEIDNAISKEVKVEIPTSDVEVLKPTEAISMSPQPELSSGDEVSWSYSPTKNKGILKGFRKARHFGRSISESGLDDVVWASYEEHCDDASVDSIIPEEEEISNSLKKTVRFNDDVTRQLFRSNSSILGQRKKKNWRVKAKKRAQERQHSESEAVDIECKKESEISSVNDKGSNNDIFELEMN